MELEFNSITGLVKLYITTQDGAYGGLYRTYNPLIGCAHPEPPQTGGTIEFIDIIGGYWNLGSTSSANNYFMFDELVISDSFIGPPAGFVTVPSLDPYCGDGTCNGIETCSICQADCGACFISGDLNNDGNVNIFDYNILLENFGNQTCGNVADLNGDCRVSIFDYNILLENFERSY